MIEADVPAAMILSHLVVHQKFASLSLFLCPFWVSPQATSDGLRCSRAVVMCTTDLWATCAEPSLSHHWGGETSRSRVVAVLLTFKDDQHIDLHANTSPVATSSHSRTTPKWPRPSSRPMA